MFFSDSQPPRVAQKLSGPAHTSSFEIGRDLTVGLDFLESISDRQPPAISSQSMADYEAFDSFSVTALPFVSSSIGLSTNSYFGLPVSLPASQYQEFIANLPDLSFMLE